MTVVERAGDLLRRWSATDRAYPLGYVHALDGARGLMTLGVMAAHTRPALLPGASLFMDVFFAMSGYLITSLLINDYRKRGAIDFKKFYLRRFLRLTRHSPPCSSRCSSEHCFFRPSSRCA
jgi:hypothetical protein